ncbi:MAG: S8 family serine peptidase [Chlorobi bacterium]|nr:S8 family serine peptidase [Chlorobiota bacterium]
MNKIKLTIFVFILAVFQVTAQIAPDKYYIQFTDKNNSPYSIDKPEEFLTGRAIQRREKQDIPIMENDIPVNPQYLQGVADIGVELLNATRWLNGVTIYTTDTSKISQIKALPYVEGVMLLQSKGTGRKKAFFENESIENKIPAGAASESPRSTDELDYGEAWFQINQINGIPLHNAGFKGEGMVIAVLDGGFVGAQTNPVFDSMWANNQVLGTKDFVNPGGSVFTESSHGKSVLSTMAANYPGLMIGTAPKASYWLLHTEDVKTENVIEEYNWMSGAEFADSVGADIINSSLSYVDFDMPEWDHTYDDLDGNTAVSTIAADIAASKGILVCNSAGNSGGGSFPWNGAPADADSVISVGAVGYNNQRAGFSSIGPTVDGRIRPVVMALGANTVVAVGNDTVGTGSGTSFSSPIIAGMNACLWQANPESDGGLRSFKTKR